MPLEQIQWRLATGLANSQRLHDYGRDQHWIAQRRQRDKVNSTGKVFLHAAGYFHSQARLADSAGPCDGDEARIFREQELFRGGDFFFPTAERWALRGNVAGASFRLPRRGLLREAVANSGKFARQISRSEER